MKIKFLIILLLSVLNSFSQTVFDEGEVNSIDSKLDSILIIGIGSSVSRVFLEDVSQYIIQGLNKSNVIGQYNYLGRNIDDAKKELDSIKNKAVYNAILIFLPKGASLYEVQNNKYQDISGTKTDPIRTTTYSSAVIYSQVFDLQLCISKNNMKKVWSANVGVGGDPKKTKNAKKVAKKIITCFKTNKYID